MNLPKHYFKALGIYEASPFVKLTVPQVGNSRLTIVAPGFADSEDGYTPCREVTLHGVKTIEALLNVLMEWQWDMNQALLESARKDQK